MSVQRCVQVTRLDGTPVLAPIPRGGRASTTEVDRTGTRWLTVRTWWGRRTIRMPITTPPSPAPDWTDEGRDSWGGYCGDSIQLWWIQPNTQVDPGHPSYVDLEIGVVEMEILSALVTLSHGREGLLMSPEEARTTGMRLLAVAAAAEAGRSAFEAQPHPEPYPDLEDESR